MLEYDYAYSSYAEDMLVGGYFRKKGINKKKAAFTLLGGGGNENFDEVEVMGLGVDGCQSLQGQTAYGISLRRGKKRYPI